MSTIPSSMSIVEILGELANGRLIADCDNAMVAVAKAIDQYGGKGRVEIKLRMEPSENGAGTLVISPEVKAVAPAPGRPHLPSVFYIRGDGTLSRRDPRQMDLVEESEKVRQLHHKPEPKEK